MNKIFKHTLLLVVLQISWAGVAGAATDDSIEDQMKSLELPSNRAPVNLESESLYAIQSRYSPLRSRSEISVSGGSSLTGGGGFSSARELAGTERVPLTDRWQLGGSGSFVSMS